MRILVVSDSHGNEYALRKAITDQPEAKHVFYLGDGARDIQEIQNEFPEKQFHVVCGNCDFGYSSTIPESGMEIVKGQLIFYTHGHRYDVKSGLYRIVCAARERNAKILLYGHTHIAKSEYADNLYILNPGSLINRKPTYGVIDFTSSGIFTNIMEMK